MYDVKDVSPRGLNVKKEKSKTFVDNTKHTGGTGALNT
jgi:hypothetical protein